MIIRYFKLVIRKLLFLLSIVLSAVGLILEYYLPNLEIPSLIYILLLLFGFIWANFKLFEENYKGDEQDKKLFKSFLKILPVEGTIDFIRTFDFGAIIDMDKLDQLLQFIDKCRQPDFIFLDKYLEKYKNKLLQKSLEWRNIISANTFSTNHTTKQFYRIKGFDNHTDSSEFDEIQSKLNQLADDIVENYDKLIVSAKKRNIYS